MRIRDAALLVGTASVGMFAYGMLVESKRLTLERHTLRLPLWPASHAGFTIAVLSDFHVRGFWSLELGQEAVSLALAQNPDMVVLPGDFVDHWQPGSEEQLYKCLARLAALGGRALAVPGNHDYTFREDAGRLSRVLDPLGIKLLRNESWEHQGITWLGIDSAVEKKANPKLEVLSQPAIAVWHEPDLVDQLPDGVALQISGHSHGGQWRFPFGITPMHSYLGKRYPRGYYPDAPTPLYVSRGIGTTGPPSRFLCPPEISVLTLQPG